MAQYITVQNKAHLDALQNHSHGEVAYCEDTKELWIYDENEKQWIKFQADNTGIDLTDNLKDFTYEYYLETDDGSELVEDPEMQAGRYNLVLTTSEDCEIGEKTLICSFMVNKLPTEITPKNDTVKYNGTRYDLEELFTIDENAGTKTYSIMLSIIIVSINLVR